MKKEIINKSLKRSYFVFAVSFTLVFMVTFLGTKIHGNEYLFYRLPGAGPIRIKNLSFRETLKFVDEITSLALFAAIILTLLFFLIDYEYNLIQEKKRKKQALTKDFKGVTAQIDNSLLPSKTQEEILDRDNPKDVIIKSIANTLEQRYANIYLNLSYQKNVHINTVYPDIVIAQKNDNIVNQIIVVFSDKEELYTDKDKLKMLSNLRSNFFILIPTHLKEEAEKYCKENDIAAYIHSYVKDEDTNIMVNW